LLVVPVIHTVTEHPEKVAGAVAPISVNPNGVAVAYYSNFVVSLVDD
jgi:hypothetical protein